MRGAGAFVALAVWTSVAIHGSDPQQAAQPEAQTTLREFVPLAHARYFGEAELTLANFGPQPVAVTPAWLVRGSDVVVGRPIEVPPSVPLFLPLASVLPEGITLSTVDGLHITYEGVAVMHVAAQVTLIPKSGSQLDQSLDVPPTIPVDVRGRHMEAVWATPRHDERAIIVLANLSDTANSVQMTRPDRSEQIALDSGEVRLLPEEASSGSRGVDWARFDSSQSGIRASGFVLSRTDRVPHLLRFYDPSAAARPSLWANDLRLGNGSLAVSLKNTLDRPVQATASLLDSTDGHLLADLPLLMLGPHAGAALDVATAAAGARLSGSATLRVLASEGPGSLIGDLESVDSTTGLQRDGPLRDSGWDNTSYRRGTGNCAWRIDDDYTTHVVLTNVGEADTRYNVDLRSGAQDYVFEQQTLAQGATVTLDLRRIRDQRAADRMHRTLPPDAERGTCHWSIVGAPGTPSSSLRLMGRAEITSPSRRVSSTHTF